jgi:hypothetical protein
VDWLGPDHVAEVSKDAVCAGLAEGEAHLQARVNPAGSSFGADEERAAHVGACGCHLNGEHAGMFGPERGGCVVIGPALGDPHKALPRRGPEHDTRALGPLDYFVDVGTRHNHG